MIIDRICRGCELEISGILLTVDFRVMDMSEFEIILGMDWLTTHRVVIDYDRMRVTAYTPDGTCVVFQGNRHDASPHTVYNSRWHGKLTILLARSPNGRGEMGYESTSGGLRGRGYFSG